MDLFDSISKRKSCRDYTQQPLGEEKLEEIRRAIDGFDPLYPDVPLEYWFVTEARGLFKVRAPHYLIISGQGKEGELENVGFLFQQLVLWLDAHNIGCVWLGSTKDIEQNLGGKDIIAIALGQTKGATHRSEAEFKRKSISQITNAPDDVCIQAIHLAPSGMNIQPWYLEKTGEQILLYKQSLTPPLSMLYKKTEVDMGIALCHYALACKHFGRPFAFERKTGGEDKKGYRLFGVLTC